MWQVRADGNIHLFIIHFNWKIFKCETVFMYLFIYVGRVLNCDKNIDISDKLEINSNVLSTEPHHFYSKVCQMNNPILERVFESCKVPSKV